MRMNAERKRNISFPMLYNIKHIKFSLFMHVSKVEYLTSYFVEMMDTVFSCAKSGPNRDPSLKI